MHAVARSRHMSLASPLLAFGGGALAQERVPAADWTRIGDHTGMLIFLILAVGALSIFVLNRQLRRELAKRRQSEVEAIEARSRLNAILNNAGVGVLLADSQARHVDVNHRWCRMFGYRRREARGTLTTRDIAHPDEAASLQEHFRALLAGEIKSRTQERRFLRKDGSIFWGLISTSTVLDRAGRRKWVVGMITDIDTQKQIEAALRESEERLRFITENTHDIVWQLDRDLRFTYINGADERMRGYAREEVIGQHFKEIVTPAGYLTIERTMSLPPAPGDAGNGVKSFEVEMRCKDGNRVWAEINSTPIRDRSGQIAGYIGVTRDATQHRKTHEKLREQTIRDPLTGLFNRRYLDESLERELARAKRDNLPLSLLMIDIDRFKLLNDTHGHQAGDEVLKCLGKLIREGARSADLPCRYGGEEFLLVLPGMTLEIAAERAEQWRGAFAGAKIDFGRTSLSATLSVGVAAFPGHGSTCAELIAAADQALYTAKHSGRNRVAIAPGT